MNNFEEKLSKYAEVIVKIGANVQKGQKVWVNCTTDALPLVYKVTELAYQDFMLNINRKKSIHTSHNGKLTKEMIILTIMSYLSTF